MTYEELVKDYQMHLNGFGYPRNVAIECCCGETHSGISAFRYGLNITYFELESGQLVETTRITCPKSKRRMKAT